MGRYAVDPAQLHDVDRDFGSTVAHARAALASLGAEMHALLDAGWRSPAATAFAASWHEWHAGAIELLASLEEMGRAIGMSGHGYATTEQAVRSTVAAS
jgi:WXG100 family type VII secretion target